jgi:hypothetical protein
MTVETESARSRGRPGRGHRSMRVDLGLGLALVAVPWVLRLLAAPEDVAFLLALLVGPLLGALVVLRWNVPLPVRAPWPRVVLVTVVLAMASVFVPGVSRNVRPEGAVAIVAAILVVPAAVGYELFFRGGLYSVLEARRGPVLAIAGPAALEALFAVNTTSLLPPITAFVLGARYGFSRTSSRSIVPAVLARGLLAAAVACLLLTAH